MNSKKRKLISGIASLLAATIIYISGGQIIIAPLLAGIGIYAIPRIVRTEETQKNDATYVQEESSKLFNESLTKKNKEKVAIAPIKRYSEELIPELITIDALTQKEKVLVRMRKKETEEKLKYSKELKK